MNEDVFRIENGIFQCHVSFQGCSFGVLWFGFTTRSHWPDGFCYAAALLPGENNWEEGSKVQAAQMLRSVFVLKYIIYIYIYTYIYIYIITYTNTHLLYICILFLHYLNILCRYDISFIYWRRFIFYITVIYLYIQLRTNIHKYTYMYIHVLYIEPKWPLFWLEKALFWRVDLQT